MNTATYIRTLTGFTGEARLYRVDPPMRDDEGGTADYVVVSATEVFGEPETYIFAASEDGAVTGWGELDGSFRGELNHERALREAGYETAEVS